MSFHICCIFLVRGYMRIMMRCSLLFLALCCLAAAAEQRHTCIHGHRGNELTVGVQLEGEEHSVKRQSAQPIRFFTYSDSTVTADLPPSKRAMIMDVVPSLLNFFSDTVSVTPLQSPILLDRTCGGGYFQPEQGSNVRRCVNSCVTTTCGTVTIPDDHLKQCIECNGQQPPNCVVGDPSTDGSGVSNTDYILYISANQDVCPGQSTLAFAGACQMESSVDRPIAGYINFCPGNLEETTRDFLFDVTKHELLHALAFSSSLIPFWRNSDGTPRTSRLSGNLPPFDSESNMYVADTNTVTTVNYTDWRTISGSRVHAVIVLVTEAILAAGREHFGCEELVGVELENQGGQGTALQHWEKRLLGNEAMTGIFDFNPVFSRLTLAALEDSGWYTVDYSAAEPLLWGRGRGCDFVQQGCGDMLDMEPFCNNEQGEQTLGCTLDRGSTASCSIQQLDETVIADYRYLTGDAGGSLEIGDYCPYYREFNYGSGRIGNCADPLNQPDPSTSGSFIGEDTYAETYGPDSVCLLQRRAWEKSYPTESGTRTISVPSYGGGCYKVECLTGGGVRVFVRGLSYECSCPGQEIVVDIVDCDFTFRGSIICPACSSVCGDLCPSPEPAACDDTVVELPQERFDCTTAPPTTGTDPQVTDPGNTDPQSTNTTTNSTVPLLASTGLLSLTPALVLVLLCRI